MPEPTDQIIEQIGVHLRLYKPGLQPVQGDEYLTGPDSYQQAQSRLSAAIRSTLPGDSYRIEADRIHAVNRSPGWRVPRLLGVLTALHDDYRAGHMHTLQELVHADLFADFLDMAKELLKLAAVRDGNSRARSARTNR